MSVFRTMMLGASLALTAAIVPAAAANAAVSASVDIGDTATLVAHGAGISATVTVTCTSDLPLAYGYVSMSATQRQGQALAQGSGSTQVTSCDGTPQTYTVMIIGDRPFRVGDIIASSSLEVCDAEYTCVYTLAREVIRVRR